MDHDIEKGRINWAGERELRSLKTRNAALEARLIELDKALIFLHDVVVEGKSKPMLEAAIEHVRRVLDGGA